MLTIRKTLSNVLGTPDFDEDGTPSYSGGSFLYEVLKHERKGNHRWRCYFKHVRDEVEDLVVDVNCGQNKPDPESVLEMVWRDLDDWFRAQSDYKDQVSIVSKDDLKTIVELRNWRGDITHHAKILNDAFSDERKLAVGRFMAMWIDDFGYAPDISFRVSSSVSNLVSNLETFLGDYWEEFQGIDFRYKAFEGTFERELIIGLWDHRHPDSDEWVRVAATVDWGFNLKHGQVPSVSVTYTSADKDSPYGGGAGVGRLAKEERQLFTASEWQAIEAIDKFHLWNLDGTGLHWLANARYHRDNGNLEAAKSCFGWGLHPYDNYENDREFRKALADTQLTHYREGRETLITYALAKTMLSSAQDHYREEVRKLTDCMLSGDWRTYFDTKL